MESTERVSRSGGMSKRWFSVRAVIITIVACGAASAAIHPAQMKPSVEYHDTAAIPLTPYAAMQARAYLADTTGFAYAQLPAGMKQGLRNHHNQEQISFAIEGTFDMLIGGTRQRLEHSAVL